MQASNKTPAPRRTYTPSEILAILSIFSKRVKLRPFNGFDKGQWL